MLSSDIEVRYGVSLDWTAALLHIHPMPVTCQLTSMCLKRHSHFKCKQKPFWVRKHRENEANINRNLEVIAGVIEAGWHSPPRTVQPNGGRHLIYAPASALFVETYPRRVVDKLN